MENLELQQLEALFFLLLGLIFLVIVGLVIYVVLANRRQRNKIAKAHEAEKLAPRPALRVTGQILSLVRPEAGASLEVEVAGARYHRLAEVDDPQVKRQIVEAALELIRFTGALGQEPAVPVSGDETFSWREDLRSGSAAELEQIRAIPSAKETQTPSPPAAEEVEEQFLNLLTEMGQTSPPLEKPSIVGALRQKAIPTQVGPESPHTFVDEIDTIVQRRVQLIPALSGRGLHVRLGPEDSVRFLFEGREYDDLDQLPNMTARHLIRDAIREWEETT